MSPDDHLFRVGDIVSVRASPQRRGVVVEIRASTVELQYIVFLDGRRDQFYESQLEPLSEEKEERLRAVSVDEFRARLTAQELLKPGTRNLYSLESGRIDFIPYQFRPVLKFIRAERPRLLIADEVGVGKTIETGLLIRELRARQALRRVMIVCSKALISERKWQNEMRRFDEEFVALDGPAFRHCLAETDLDGEWPSQYPRVIVPYSLFSEELLLGDTSRRPPRPGLATLQPPPRFDLLIVDEAHNARNSATNLHQGLRILADNAEAVVFLTATPIQLGSGDLYSLLNLLRPDVVIDQRTFEQMAAPNPSINQAIADIRQGAPNWQTAALEALSEAGTSSQWGRAVLSNSPDFKNVVTRLSSDVISSHDRVRLVHDVEQLHSFAFIISRTRRRDIGSFTTRKPTSVLVEFTSAQSQVHDMLLSAQARILENIHGSQAVSFMMSTIRRQAASCIHGLAPHIESILSRHLSELESAEIDPEYLPPTAGELVMLRDEIKNVVAAAKALPPEDPKLDQLRKIISEKGNMSNNKLLIFSTFRHTLRYLEHGLESHGVRVGTVHGDVSEDRRRELRSAFARPRDDHGAIDVLLSSEVGSEGLDYQFCDAMVNYDIPWNPMRIEQRIGRIDRYGQKSDAVAIYNFITPGTVDYAIYERCLLRIGVFERSIGGNEAILGQIARQVQRVAEDLSLTAEEQESRLRQIADNEIRLMLEQQDLETKQSALFGLQLSKDLLEKDLEEASSPWLSPSALELLVSTFLRSRFGADRVGITGSGDVKTLRLSPEDRRSLQREAGRRDRGPANMGDRLWEKWLLGDRNVITLSFTRPSQDSDAMQVTPSHPLVQQAANALSNESAPIVVTCRVATDRLRSGRYPYAVSHWQYLGIRQDAQLVLIADDDDTGLELLELLSKAVDVPPGEVDEPTPLEIKRLESRQYSAWQNRKAVHLETTAALARLRRESLTASHRARMATLREQVDGATNERIRRMRSSQIAQADAEFENNLEQLTNAEQTADITIRLVGYGVLDVVPNNG